TNDEPHASAYRWQANDPVSSAETSLSRDTAEWKGDRTRQRRSLARLGVDRCTTVRFVFFYMKFGVIGFLPRFGVLIGDLGFRKDLANGFDADRIHNPPFFGHLFQFGKRPVGERQSQHSGRNLREFNDFRTLFRRKSSRAAASITGVKRFHPFLIK